MQPSTTPSVDTRQQSASLLRSVTRLELTAVTINAVVGAGIFGLPSRVYALAGDYALPAFVVCAFFALLIALCFGEVASRFSQTGGPYIYTRRSFGELIGFQVGWLMWLARVAAFAANSNLMVSYLGQFWPAAAFGSGRVFALTAITGLNFIVNLTGIRNAAIANHLFTVGKLAPLAFFVATGLFAVDWTRVSFSTPPTIGSFLSSVLLLVYAFTGFEMSSIPAGELRDPRRDLPVALLTAVGVITALYILVQTVCIGTLPGLAASDRPLSDAAQTFLGAPGASLIAAGVIISITGNLNVTMLAGSRLMFAMAEGGSLPAAIAWISPRFRTPWIAITATVLPMWLLALSGTFAYAAAVSAIARLVVFLSTAAALIRLRQDRSAPAATFPVPGGVVIAVTTILICILLLASATAKEAWSAGVAAAVGLAAWSLNRGRIRSRASLR